MSSATSVPLHHRILHIAVVDPKLMTSHQRAVLTSPVSCEAPGDGAPLSLVASDRKGKGEVTAPGAAQARCASRPRLPPRPPREALVSLSWPPTEVQLSCLSTGDHRGESLHNYTALTPFYKRGPQFSGVQCGSRQYIKNRKILPANKGWGRGGEMCWGRDSEGQERNRSGNTCAWTQPDRKRKPPNIRGAAEKKRADRTAKDQIQNGRRNTEVSCVLQG